MCVLEIFIMTTKTGNCEISKTVSKRVENPLFLPL